MMNLFDKIVLGVGAVIVIITMFLYMNNMEIANAISPIFIGVAIIFILGRTAYILCKDMK